jgi:hypothetical protein
MGRAKEIDLKPIPENVARRFVKRNHYSGRVVNNSCLHFGAFLDGVLHGVMQFGPSMDKSNLIGLVEGTEWNGFIELNRMTFDAVLPRNSESRCIGLAIRMIRKNAPHIKWIVSFADGCQCGDGTIYRASNFVLTGIKRNTQIWQLPDGSTVSGMTLTARGTGRPELGGKTLLEVGNGKWSIKRWAELTGAKMLPGYMLRYIYFVDPTWRERLTVPVIPFSKIREMGAGMYRGKRREKETLAGHDCTMGDECVED